MCTVVCRWSPGATVHLLAVRDEFVGREFDGPGRWWPQQSDVIGGRDRQAGGTWCACDVRTGAIAVVLNRPDRPQAQPGAASRGVLPLLALSHGMSWPKRLNLAPMASFNLMLVTTAALTWWSFNGDSLLRTDLLPGVHMAKPRGLVDRPDPRLTDPDRWRAALAATEVRADPSGLLVRVERGAAVYASVFAQFITVTPGFVTIDHSRTPRQPDSFEHGEWRAVLSS
jgi:uncharacterized protein with NRDE domain